MRTSDRIRRSLRNCLAAAVCALSVVSAAAGQGKGAGAADGGGGDGGAGAAVLQFHTFEPARPRRKASAVPGLSFWKGDLEKARAAWRKGRFRKARKAFERAFGKGNLVAAWYLGHIYRLGRGVRADDEKAFRYYRQVALAYDPEESDKRRLLMTVDALVRVADYYRTGIGKARKRRDPRRAFRLYNIAAGHNYPPAFYGLGLIELKGEGMKKRPRRAINWLMKAVRLHHAPAALLLGDLAAHGLKGHVRKDPVAALSWYLVAAKTAEPALRPKALRRVQKARAAAGEAGAARAERLAASFFAAYAPRRRKAAAAR